MSTRPQPTAKDDLKVLGKTAWNLVGKGFAAVRQKLDPNTQVTGILLDRYYALREGGQRMSHEAALEATLAAAKADLTKAIEGLERAAQEAEDPGGGNGAQ